MGRKQKMIIYNLDNSNTDYYNPYPVYEKMRKESPFLYKEESDTWHIFRYDDVKTVLSDYENFSSIPNEKNYSSKTMPKTLVRMDPPKHTQLRFIVNRSFTPKVLVDWEPRIQQIIAYLFDRIANQQEIDFVRDFAVPLPMMVIAEMLGVSSKYRDQFKKWSDDLVFSPQDNSEGELEKALAVREKADQELCEFFAGVVEEKRGNSGNDLVSILIKAEEEELKLSNEELVAYCIQLLLAGNETTRNLLSNMVYTLTESGNVYEEMKKDKTLVPNFIEEVLRYRSPVQAMSRIVKQDIEINGNKMHKGQVALAWIGSANRDEDKFEGANDFNIHRNPNSHIAFGHGIHFCLGAPLVRIETRLATNELLKRYASFSFLEGQSVIPFEPGITLGLKSFPLRVHQ